MIEKQMNFADGAIFTVMCDDGGCNETEDFEGTFMGVVEQMKESGWAIKKDGRGWHHSCPSCSEPSEFFS